MDRLIQDNGETRLFDISVLLHQGFPYVDRLFGKPISLTVNNNEVSVIIKRHTVPFEHIPAFNIKSTKTSYILPLIEFTIYSVPIDYKFFIKKLKRNKSRINKDILEKYPHWEYIGISTVLRRISIEIINQLIDYYRIFTLKISIPPVSEGSILYITYQTKNEKSVHAIEDSKLGSRKFDAIEEESGEYVDRIQNFINLSDEFIESELKIVNSIRFLESGHYPECISTIIDSFHYYIDYLIGKYVQNESLLEKFKEDPAYFNSKDKTTWIFEILSGATLQKFLSDLGHGNLYEQYSEYKTIRNDIIHPKPGKKIKLSFGRAYNACQAIMMIIRFIRKRIENIKTEHDILARLDTYIFSLLDNT